MNISNEEFSGDGEYLGLNHTLGFTDKPEWLDDWLKSLKEMMKSNLTTVFFPAIYTIVFIMGLPTNIMAIWVFLFRTKKKHPASILMASLALVDLLFIIWLPLKIVYHINGNWMFGETLCRVLIGSFYSNMYSSTIFIAVISVQRYYAVVHPLSNRFNSRVAVYVSVLVCVVVWLLSTPLYMYDQTIPYTIMNLTTCHDTVLVRQIHIPAAYFLTMGVVGFVVPCIVCIVAYVLMFYHLSNSDISSNSGEKKKKAIRLMIVILVLFVVSFTPSNILQSVHYINVTAKRTDKVYCIYIVALCLSSLNSCIDPFMYFFISKEFRDHVRNILICRSERKAKRMKVSITETKNNSFQQHIQHSS